MYGIRARPTRDLTLVGTRQRVHSDLGCPGGGVGGAVAGPRGPPGAREAQRAGQGAEHLGAGWHRGGAETRGLLGGPGKPAFRGGRGLAEGSTHGRRAGCRDPGHPRRGAAQLRGFLPMRGWENGVPRWCALFPRVPSVRVILLATGGWSALTRSHLPGGSEVVPGSSQLDWLLWLTEIVSVPRCPPNLPLQRPCRVLVGP